jgi:translation initiation factor IF-1
LLVFSRQNLLDFGRETAHYVRGEAAKLGRGTEERPFAVGPDGM